MNTQRDLNETQQIRTNPELAQAARARAAQPAKPTRKRPAAWQIAALGGLALLATGVTVGALAMTGGDTAAADEPLALVSPSTWEPEPTADVSASAEPETATDEPAAPAPTPAAPADDEPAAPAPAAPEDDSPAPAEDEPEPAQADNQAPVIHWVKAPTKEIHENSFQCDNTTRLLRASISDNVGLVNPRIIYFTQATGFVIHEMTLNSYGNYKAEVGPFPVGTVPAGQESKTITVSVVAEDAAGNTVDEQATVTISGDNCITFG